MFANAQRVQAAAVNAGGAGYAVGNAIQVLTDAPQLFNSFQASVATVDGNGAVLTLNVLDFGGWLNAPISPVAISGGSGNGLSLNLTFTLYWQNVPWVAPTAAGLEFLLSVVVQSPVNLLSDNTSRQDQVVRLAVQKIRGAIGVARKTPLSVTAGSVPPESESHAYALALQMLIGSNPNLAKYAISEAGSSKPALALMIDEATAWLKEVRDGRAVEYPSDPDPSFRTAVLVGASAPEEDLLTFSAPNYFNTPDASGQLGQP